MMTLFHIFAVFGGLLFAYDMVRHAVRDFMSKDE